MQPILAYQVWLALPMETRVKLASLFGVVKTGRVTVEYRATGPIVTADGYTPDDLRAITLAKLQTILTTEDTNFYELVEVVIENIDAIVAKEFKYTSKKPPEEKKIEVGDRVFIEQAFEDETGAYGDAYAKVLKVGKRGKLDLEFEDPKLQEALQEYEYRIDDVEKVV